MDKGLLPQVLSIVMLQPWPKLSSGAPQNVVMRADACVADQAFNLAEDAGQFDQLNSGQCGPDNGLHPQHELCSVSAIAASTVIVFDGEPWFCGTSVELAGSAIRTDPCISHPRQEPTA
jgi:hypothetical protein